MFRSTALEGGTATVNLTGPSPGYPLVLSKVLEETFKRLGFGFLFFLFVVPKGRDAMERDGRIAGGLMCNQDGGGIARGIAKAEGAS